MQSAEVQGGVRDTDAGAPGALLGQRFLCNPFDIDR